jgi:CubicO group peptidase (beta-lactamase class C family)
MRFPIPFRPLTDGGRQALSAALATLLASAVAAGSTAQESEQAFPVATPESVGLSDEALAELASEVRGYLESDLAVGAELLVIKDRRTVLHECFGLADRAAEEPWVDGTLCNIRSMTKPLTGAAIQILVDRGELSLDDPVAAYLPGFDTDEAREITVHQLLTHRSGLPLTALTSMDEHASLREMGDAIGARGPEFEPGSRFWYSDSGTDALGAVVEVVSGRTLDTFVREELLSPLGMSESFYYLDDQDPRRTRIASLYIGGPGSWQRFLDPDEATFYPFAWGSQSLYSTPEDYARFLAMWMDRGLVGERRVLSEDAVARTLTPVSDMSMLGSEARFPTSFRGLEVDYGQMAVLHVPAGSDGPPRIIGHSGSDGTIAWAWPERDLMILYFTQSRGGSSALRLEEAIDRLLISPESYSQVAEVPEELQEYLGTYIADWSTHMKEELVIQYENGSLRLDVPSQMLFELAPTEQEGKWSFAIVPSITVWFERDEQGQVDCLRIHQEPLTFEAPRKGTPHEQEVAEANRPDPAVVGKYLGHYHDPEADEEVEVLIDGDYVALKTSQGTFHLWKIPVADAWQVRESPLTNLTFEEEDGQVVSLTRHSPGGKQLVCPRLR